MLPLPSLARFAVVLLLLPIFASSQAAPAQAPATEFQTAIEHLKQGRIAAAEPILQKLIKTAPNDPDINEAMGMLVAMKEQPERAIAYLEKAVKLKPNARAYTNLAAAYNDLNRDDLAVIALRKAVDLEPSNLNLVFNLAGLYMKHNVFAEAAPLLERVVKARPAAEPSYLLALCYSATNRPTLARKTLLALPAKERDREEIQLLLGTAALNMGQKAEAQANFERVLKLNPESVPGAANLGEMLVAAGAVERGLPMLEGAWKRDNTSYLAGYNLALAYRQTGKLEAARSVLATLLTKQESGEIFHLLGEIEATLKDNKAAVTYLSRAVELDPSEGNYFDLGYRLLQSWTLDQAAAAFAKGLQPYPKSPRLWMGLGSAYFAQGKNEEAVGAYLQGTEESADPRSYRLLGQAYLAATSVRADVTSRLHRSRLAHPQDAWASFYEGAALLRAGDAEQALPLLQRAIEIDPQLAESHFELGNLYTRKEQTTAALAEYETAVKLQPAYQEAYSRLGQIYAKAGRTADAAAAMAKYDELRKQEAASREARMRGAIAMLQP